MLSVALTGGLATGKSFVGGIFEELGCYRIEADRLGHQVLERGGEVYAAVVELFGDGIVDERGSIDRRKLGALVFSDRHRLGQLNALVHPAVERLRQKRLGEIELLDAGAIVICEAAIYIETGAWRRFDKVVLTLCGREVQLQRAMLRSGWSRGEAEARLNQQWPDEEKRKVADYVINTAFSLEETRRQTIEVYNCLKAI